MSLDVRLKITSDVTGAKAGINSLAAESQKLEKQMQLVSAAGNTANTSIAALGISGAASVAGMTGSVKALAGVVGSGGLSSLLDVSSSTARVKQLDTAIDRVSGSARTANTSLKLLGSDGSRAMRALDNETDRVNRSVLLLGENANMGDAFDFSAALDTLDEGESLVDLFNQRLKLTPALAALAEGSVGAFAFGASASLSLLNGVAMATVKYLALLSVPVAVGGGALTASAMAANKEFSIFTDTLGVNRQALETWTVAADDVSLEADKVADIFKNVNEKIGEFVQTGGGEAADIFKQLPLDAQELVNLAPDQVLLKVAKALDAMPDMSLGEKTFLLDSLADDASKLLPLLEGNAKRLRDVEVAARSVGAIMSPVQIKTMEEARVKMSAIKRGLTGIRNEVGTLGASFINAFDGEINSAIAGFRGWLLQIPHDLTAMKSAWTFAFADMSDEAKGATEDSSEWVDKLFTDMRLGFTYMPVYAKAGYEAISGTIKSWYYSAAATYDRFDGSVSDVMASVLSVTKEVYRDVVNIGGTAIAFLIERYSDFISAVSYVGKIPGFEDFGEKLKGVSAQLDATAERAKNAGDTMSKGMDETIRSYRLSAATSRDLARANDELSKGAKIAANQAVAAAVVFVKDAEAKRAAGLAADTVTRSQFALGKSLDKTGDSSKRYRVNTEAVNDALKDSTVATDKKKTAVDQLKQAMDQELASLLATNTALTNNGIASYRAGLLEKHFTKGVIESAVALKYQNTLLSARKALMSERVGLSQKVTATYEYDLGEAGLNPDDIKDLADQKIQIHFEAGQLDLAKQRDELISTNEAFRRGIYDAQGYAQSMIDLNIAAENGITVLKERQSLLRDRVTVDSQRLTASLEFDLEDKGIADDIIQSIAADRIKLESDKVVQALQLQVDELKHGEVATARSTREAQGFAAAQIKVRESLEAQVKSLSAVKSARESLELDQLGLSQRITAKLEFDLDSAGVADEVIQSIAADRIKLESDKVVQALQLQVAELKHGEVATARSTREAQGFAAAQIKVRESLEAQVRSLSAVKSARESLESDQLGLSQRITAKLEFDLDSAGVADEVIQSIAADRIKLESDKVVQALQLQVAELKHGEVATARSTREAQGFAAAQIKVRESLEAQVRSLSAVKSVRESLVSERLSLDQSVTAQLEFDLTKAGVGADLIESLKADKVALEFDKITAAMQKQRQEAVLTSADNRVLGLTLQGFSEPQAEFIRGFEAQTEKLQTWRGITDKAFDSVGNKLTEIAMTGKTDWSDLVQTLIDETFRMMIIQPLVDSLKQSFSNFGGSGGAGGSGGWVNAALQIATSFFADGGAFGVGGVQMFADGGAFTNSVVAEPTLFSMGSKKLGMMGEAGPEAIMPLTRTSGGELGIRAELPPVAADASVVSVSPQIALSQGQPVFNIAVNNLSGGQSQAEVQNAQPNGTGGFDMDVIVRDIEGKMVQNMSDGKSKLGKTMDNRYVRTRN